MSKEIFDIVDIIVQEKGTSINKVIPILQEVQLKFNYLPELAFATLYGLAVYAAVLWIRRLIKK